MKLIDINPHIRYAGQFTYVSQNIRVYVKDCRLFYIIDGKGKIHINNTQLNLKPNTIFYCAGGSDYLIESEEPLLLYVFNFDLSQNHNHLTSCFAPVNFYDSENHIPTDKCHIEDSHFLNSFLLLENDMNFKNIFSEITEEFSSQQIYHKEICNSKLKNLLVELHRTNINKSDNSSDAVNKIINYLKENFRKEIKNNELSNLAGYHEYYLNRIFIKRTGTSMHKYILNLRINESKQLLVNTNMPISDIAFEVGFNSNTHFVTYFKKETSLTPFKYRRNFKNNI